MNTERLDHLLRQYFDSEITGGEIAELGAALHTRPEAREQFWKHAHVHGALREWGLESGSAIELRAMTPPVAVLPSRREPTRWLSWRPMAAAAAGLAFGLFCASVAWAVASPRAVATVSRLFALVDGSFEKQTGTLPAGFPATFGVWSGDLADVIRHDIKQATDGGRILRFLQAELEPALPRYGAASCDVYQLVDLRPLKADAALGDATLELSVQFLDAREASGQRIEFMSKLYLFSGKPDALHPEWPISQNQALAAGSSSCESIGGSPQSWRSVIAKALLPAEADFAVVHLLAHLPDNKLENKPGGLTPAVFRQQFADDVRLTLKTQPKLPVRLAQRQ